jgi:hypothetical protein
VTGGPYWYTNKHDALRSITSISAIPQADGTPSIKLSYNSLGANPTLLTPTEGVFSQYYIGLLSFDGTGFNTEEVKSMAETFKGAVKLGTVTGMADWVTRNVLTLRGMFDGCSSLTSINDLTPNAATGAWDVSKVTDFSRMFAGTFAANAPAVLTSIATWDVSSASTTAGSGFTEMFSHSNVRTVSLRDWVMPAGAAIQNMFDEVTKLEELTINDKVFLYYASPYQSTALETTSTRLAAQGSWMRITSPWQGTGVNVSRLYSDPANVAMPVGVATYRWDSSKLYGRFANDNAWWMYVNGNLTIGVDDPTKDKVITEGAGTVPWKTDASLAAMPLAQKVESVSFTSDVILKDFAEWFKGYSKLQVFDGNRIIMNVADSTTSLAGLFEDCPLLAVVDNVSQWDVSAITDFDRMFKNDKKLSALKIQGWNMAGNSGNPSTVNMLAGTDDLKSLILGPHTKLGDSGLGTPSDSTATSGPRSINAGSWLRVDSTTGTNVTDPDPYANDPWFGSSTDLTARYATSSNIHGLSSDGKGAYYTWLANSYRGRITPLNDNVWWSYNTGTRTLTVGVDDPEVCDSPFDSYTFGVQLETPTATWADLSIAAADLPWAKAFDAKGATQKANGIRSVVSESNEIAGVVYLVHPDSMEGWFSGYKALNSFDGTNIETADGAGGSISLKNLFNGDPDLETVDLTGWTWVTGTDRKGMFADCPSLKSITLEADTVLVGTDMGLKTDSTTKLASLDASHGRWVMQDGVDAADASALSTGDPYWFDCTDMLVARYALGGSGLKKAHEYVWDDKNLGGRIPGNANTWWSYSLVKQGDLKANTLTVGTDGGTNKTVPSLIHGSSSGTVYSAATLPWYAPIKGCDLDLEDTEDGLAYVRYIVIQDYPGLSGTTTGAGKLKVSDLTAWFAGLPGVLTFEGNGMDVSGVSSAGGGFKSLFAGDVSLEDVDIRSWMMRNASQAAVDHMFQGNRSLRLR